MSVSNSRKCQIYSSLLTLYNLRRNAISLSLLAGEKVNRDGPVASATDAGDAPGRGPARCRRLSPHLLRR